MEAMNKWLAFSLSGGNHHHAELQTSASPDPAIPDWSMNGAHKDTGNSRRTTQYSSASSSQEERFSMLMAGQAAGGSSSCNTNINTDILPEVPKLENFLGRHSYATGCNDQDASIHGYFACYNNNPSINTNTYASLGDATVDNGGCSIAGNIHHPNNNNNGSSSSSIGLSMIKSWLRNQPLAPPAPPHPEDSNNHQQQHLIIEQSNNTQKNNLSLSMSGDTKSQSQSSSGIPLSLLAPTISHGTTSASQTLHHACPDNNGSNKKDKLQRDNLNSGMNSQNSSSSCAGEAVPKRSLDTFGQRTSIYRGVTRHRWTGRYEAHLWDNSCRREGQTRKGRQVYLGGYDKEDKAARAYDLAALKYWGTTTTTNFPISNYEKEMEEMKNMTRQEFVASLRRKSSGFSRGASIYRGVTRHHQHGRWQARIGRVAGNKDLYLGTFSTQEEAAEAYDIAAIKFRGLEAVTNFDMNKYNVKSIMDSTTLPIGAAKRLKDVTDDHPRHQPAVPISTDILQVADFARINGLPSSGSNPYENIPNSAVGFMLSGINSYSQSSGWPSLAGAGLNYPPVPVYGHGQSMPRMWACKQEQPDEHDSNHRHNNHIHHFFNSGITTATTHDFFQPLSTAGDSVMLSHNYMMSSAGSVSNPDVQVLSTAYASHNDDSTYASVINHHDQEDSNNHRSILYQYGSSGTTDHLLSAYNNGHHVSAAARSLHQQQSSDDHTSGYDKYTSWIPTAIPTTGSSFNTSPRSSLAGTVNMSLHCQDAPVWCAPNEL